MNLQWRTPGGTKVLTISLKKESTKLRNIYTFDQQNIWFGFMTNANKEYRSITFVLYPLFIRIWIW